MTPLRKKRASAFKAQRKKQAAIRGAKPERNKKYREWINRLPCVVCCWPQGNWFDLIKIMWVLDFSECCHVGKTGKGMRQKCSDYETIPMCQAHHKEQHSRDGADFFERNPLPLAEVFAALRKAYEEQK